MEIFTAFTNTFLRFSRSVKAYDKVSTRLIEQIYAYKSYIYRCNVQVTVNYIYLTIRFEELFIKINPVVDARLRGVLQNKPVLERLARLMKSGSML